MRCQWIFNEAIAERMITYLARNDQVVGSHSFDDVPMEMYLCRCIYVDVPMQMYLCRCTYVDVLKYMYLCRCTYADVPMQMYLSTCTYVDELWNGYFKCSMKTESTFK